MVKDNQVYKHILQQNNQGYEELYEVLHNQSRCLKAKYRLDEDTRRELVQDTVYRVFRNLDTFSDDGKENSFFRWVGRILRNATVSYYRKTRKEITNSYFIDIIEQAPQELDEREQNIEEILHDAYDELLLNARGLSHKEISIALKKPIGTVSARISRGTNKLKKEYEKKAA